MSQGQPLPLGATPHRGGVNFSLFTANATSVELCLFSTDGQRELKRVPLSRTPGGIWCAWVAGVTAGQLYGYRVHGPWQPHQGHRFNPNKLALDPYARAITPPPAFDPALKGHFEKDDRVMNHRDSAPYAPKAKVVDLPQRDHHHPRIPMAQTILYEAHIRGLTLEFPDLPQRLRGKLAALGHPQVIQYLKGLGVTTVSLLPIHPFVSEPFLLQKGLTNYWGYNNLQYFALHPDYLCDNDPTELADTVRRLHDAGLELLMDVVFNHSAEGNEQGPSYGFRLLDNASYYRLASDPRFYENHSGCGNSLNLAHPRVLAMVTDALRYWVEQMGVDGFRFDLATSLGREQPHFDAGAGLLDAIGQDPVLSRCKLIAEPWDLGPDGYRLGQFPHPWSEWNDRFRDTFRRFWHGEPGQLPAVAEVIHGSARLFEATDRAPQASINLITSHDGYTLADLVSYNRRHNHANGEHNNDGHSHNFSCNHGHEGPSGDGQIRLLRRRQQRNLLASLMLAQGVPMLLAGDEAGNSQQGNNNAYCQDNPIGWVNWREADSELQRFVAHLIALRHRHPLLRLPHYQHNFPGSTERVQWLTPSAEPMTEPQWQDPHNRSMGLLLHDEEEALLLLLNAAHYPCDFSAPGLSGADHWHCLLHTWEGDAPTALPCTLTDRSLALFRAPLKE
ncbi:glycogen debranching protein GlgX [Ferrimonas sp. YFM]|uniref:glycogen debranching protein GlgX n=1 Tax=Ferrimonas sp. YFM TaxID=3028878 RepID=UPI0025731B91|nr:glycogen debranching protein GlgX [Ferrimonas sp. YFM]BDY05895.1 glycogen operon protein GlgX homolog [Ferrimonas sp. YFM]